jgi:hypothetical protein
MEKDIPLKHLTDNWEETQKAVTGNLIGRLTGLAHADNLCNFPLTWKIPKTKTAIKDRHNQQDRRDWKVL